MLRLKLFELMINTPPDMEALPPETVEGLISMYCDMSRVAQEGLRDKLKAHADYVLKKDLSSYKVLYEMAKTGDPSNGDSLDESFSKLKKNMDERNENTQL
jgi:hypothetical protein